MGRNRAFSPLARVVRGAASVVGLVILQGATAPTPVAQTACIYTIVADLSGGNAFEPPINGGGQVAFAAGATLRRWTGGSLTTLFAGGLTSPYPTGPVSINSSGAVAFYAPSVVDGARIAAVDGLQLVGRAFDEETVLRVAHAYGQATQWHRRRPPI